MSAPWIREVTLTPLAWWMGASLLFGFPASVVGAAPAPPADQHADAPAEPTILSEPVPAFSPKLPLSEAQRDRLQAFSSYALARSLQRQGDGNGALRGYQRSLRYDPTAVDAAEAIVRLAAALDRPGEAARCAAVLAEAPHADSLALRQVARELARQGDPAAAVGLYEKALAAGRDRPPGEVDVVVWMELGRLSHLAGDDAKASDYFSRAVEAIENPSRFGLSDRVKQALSAEKAATYDLAGRSFLLAGRTADAIAAFEKSYQAKPDQPRRAVHLAEAHLRGGEPEKALAKLEKYLRGKQKSEGIAAYRLLEEILAALQRQPDLLPRIEALYAEDEENDPLGYFLAEKYLQADRPEEALALYTRLIRRAATATGYRRLVEIEHQMDRPSELLDTLAEVVERSGSLQAVVPQCDRLAEDAKFLDRLVETARSRLKDDPAKLGGSHRLALALVLLLAERYDAAGDFFRLALEGGAKNEADLRLRWGVGMLVGERFDEAAEVFRRAAEAGEDDHQRALFQFYLAAALELGDHPQKALAAARKAIELNPDSPRFLSRRAWILYRQDRPREAAEAYRELIEKFDGDYSSARTRDLLRDARLVLSNLCIDAGRTEDAVQWLEQVLDEFPQDVSALNDLGYLWADRGKHLQRAEGMVRRAVEAAPENAAYRDSLGWVLYRRGRFKEALAQLERAARGEPDPVILDHLGDALSAAHQAERARQAWRKAIEAFAQAGREKEAAAVGAKLPGQPDHGETNHPPTNGSGETLWPGAKNVPH